MSIVDDIREMIATEVAAAEDRLRDEFRLRPEPPMSAKQAADYLGISVKLLYNLCAQQTIPHITIGSPGSRKPRLLFKRDALEMYLNKNTKNCDPVRLSP